MSIASKLNWVVATKPKAPKATEHSGAKKGKGAWDRKKTAKKTSNKARRAADKQSALGEEEAEAAFDKRNPDRGTQKGKTSPTSGKGHRKHVKEGAKKARRLNQKSEIKKGLSEGEENDGPFPGAAPLFTKASELNWNPDMTTSEPRPCYPSEDPVEDHCNPNISPDQNNNDSYMDDPYGDEGGGEDWGDQGFEVFDPGADPMGDDEGYEEDEEWSPEQWQEEIQKDAPEPAPAPAKPQKGKEKERSEKEPRDPRLGPDDPHQFWIMPLDPSDPESRTRQEARDTLLPQLQDAAQHGDENAQDLLMNGPRLKKKSGAYRKELMEELMDDTKEDSSMKRKAREQLIREGIPEEKLTPLTYKDVENWM